MTHCIESSIINFSLKHCVSVKSDKYIYVNLIKSSSSPELKIIMIK